MLILFWYLFHGNSNIFLFNFEIKNIETFCSREQRLDFYFPLHLNY